MGRLFYHTAMCLLAQINPLKPPHHDDDEIRTVQLHHAHQVCGIVAHTKDHGVASVAIRSLAIAGSVLSEPPEQHEVLDILTRIYRHTGWNLKRVHSELKRAWGWEPPEPPLNGPNAGPGSSAAAAAAAGAAGLPLPPAPHQPLIAPAAQGGTLGAAAVISQLFGPRDPNAAQQQQAQDNSNSNSNNNNNNNNNNSSSSSSNRRPSQSAGPPAPVPVHPATSTSTSSMSETRRANFTTGPPPPPATLGQPLFSMGGNGGGGGATAAVGRHNSITTASPSNHTSPSAATTHTPASASSTTNNAPTPPARPTVNPLLAQADFNQPNHPYREWYKPPERTGGNASTFGAGGLWPY